MAPRLQFEKGDQAVQSFDRFDRDESSEG